MGTVNPGGPSALPTTEAVLQDPESEAPRWERSPLWQEGPGLASQAQSACWVGLVSSPWEEARVCPPAGWMTPVLRTDDTKAQGHERRGWRLGF